MARTVYSDTVEEEWSMVRGWPYVISNHGRIARYTPAQGTSKGKLMRTRVTSEGYERVCLSRDGERWYVKVHRLVADAFIGPCPPGHQINHKDGDKLNNHADNLEWATQAQNMRHAAETGLRPRGEEIRQAKLKGEEVKAIREKLAQGVAPKILAEEYNIDASVVRKIGNRQIWKHIP